MAQVGFCTFGQWRGLTVMTPLPWQVASEQLGMGQVSPVCGSRESYRASSPPGTYPTGLSMRLGLPREKSHPSGTRGQPCPRPLLPQTHPEGTGLSRGTLAGEGGPLSTVPLPPTLWSPVLGCFTHPQETTACSSPLYREQNLNLGPRAPGAPIQKSWRPDVCLSWPACISPGVTDLHPCFMPHSLVGNH